MSKWEIKNTDEQFFKNLKELLLIRKNLVILKMISFGYIKTV